MNKVDEPLKTVPDTSLELHMHIHALPGASAQKCAHTHVNIHRCPHTIYINYYGLPVCHTNYRLRRSGRRLMDSDVRLKDLC